MNEFKRFEDRLTGLIESLSPSGRRRLSAELAKRLRQSQQRRVMAQKAPDGTPYAPRQQQSARKKTGRVKRKMFAKLITSRFLHIRASPEQASMEFYGGNRTCSDDPLFLFENYTRTAQVLADTMAGGVLHQPGYRSGRYLHGNTG